MCVKFLPQEPVGPQTEKEEETKNRRKIPAAVWLYALQAAIFALLHFTFSTNISLLLTEKGYSDASLTGSSLVESRFLTSAILAVLAAAVLLIVDKISHRKEKYNEQQI